MQGEVAIIGFGPAGFNAAVGMRTGGYDGPIRVFSDVSTLPYSPILTSYYAGGEIEYDECFPWSAAEIDDLGLEVMSGCPVVGLDVEKHVVVTEDGEYPYAKCVIATGSTPSTLGFPDSCAYRPLVLRTMEDAEVLKSRLTDEGCDHVLVSGASMVALKIVEACLRRGKKVTLVGMNPHVLDFNALPAAAERFEKGLLEKGVELRLGQTIKDVRVVDDAAHPLGRRLEVEFSTEDIEEFDEIAVAHGMRCNIDFIADGALAGNNALAVDCFMRTSDPDVYAAGDVAQALELISGEKRVVGIWKNAAIQGQCAGKAIAAEMAGREPDEKHAFKGSISSNTIAVDGTLFISAGSVDLWPERSVEVRETDCMTVVYVYEGEGASRRLVGFNVVSDYDEEGSVAYDTGAMLTLRIEESLA